MNSKFFDVNKEKQDKIINAALRIFSVKGYKDASTDIIVKEAGISKGLLFHYFESKKGLYEFICDYSAKYMTLELTRAVKSSEKDFFNVVSQIEMGKTRVLRNYPYMQQFLRGLKYEKDPEAVAQFGRSVSDLENTYNNIYAQINPKKFINPGDCRKVIDIINWMNDGLVKERINNDGITADAINDEFTEYLMLLKRHFYKSESDENISVAKEEEIERNESVMDELKMEMTFEERLLAGKRPLVDLPEEETEESKEEAKEAEEVSSEPANDEKAETTETESEDITETITEEPLEEEEDDEFFDTEDEGDVMQTGIPKVSTGEVLRFPTSGAPGSSTFSSGNINEIIEEANSNLSKQES